MACAFGYDAIWGRALVIASPIMDFQQGFAHFSTAQTRHGHSDRVNPATSCGAPPSIRRSNGRRLPSSQSGVNGSFASLASRVLLLLARLVLLPVSLPRPQP